MLVFALHYNLRADPHSVQSIPKTSLHNTVGRWARGQAVSANSAAQKSASLKSDPSCEAFQIERSLPVLVQRG